MVRKIIIGLVLISLFSAKSILIKWKNTDTLINKIGCRIFEFNEIKVKTSEVIDIDKIIIREEKEIVFEKGRQKGKINQEYGHTILKLFYNKELIAEIGNFNTNNWFSNNYEIELTEESEEIKIRYSINGPSGKNDNFQKRYFRNSFGQVIRIEYMSESGQVYNKKIMETTE